MVVHLMIREGYNVSSMSIGKRLRMRQLMKSGRAMIVALDHGMVAGRVRGLENPIEVIKTVAQSGADGILITPGILEQAIDVLGDLAVILRVDGCVSTLGTGPMKLFSSVEDAVSLGADAVAVTATLGSPYETEELEKLGTVAREGRRWGVPVVGEVLTQGMVANHTDFDGNGRSESPHDIADEVAMACRVGVELGADAINTRYSGDVDSFRRAVSCAGCPVLVAGGPSRGERLEETLALVDEVLQAGASGIVFGRQVWQHPDPVEILTALCALVHDDTTIDEALELAQA